MSIINISGLCPTKLVIQFVTVSRPTIIVKLNLHHQRIEIRFETKVQNKYFSLPIANIKLNI